MAPDIFEPPEAFADEITLLLENEKQDEITTRKANKESQGIFFTGCTNFVEIVNLNLTAMDQMCCSGLLYSSYVFCRGILKTIWVIANNLYCFPTHTLWMLTLFPLKKCKPSMYWKIEGLIYHWMISMVGCWSWVSGYNVVEVGDDVTRILDQTVLVIANHQSTADVPLMMGCFNAKEGVLPNLMWIMDSVFKYTNFGIVSYFHDDFFILSGPENRERGVQLLRRHLEKVYKTLNRKWLILFPEGGFLHKRREASNRYLEKNAELIGFSELRNVTLPRVGAMEAIIESLAPPAVHLDSTLDYNSAAEEGVDPLSNLSNHVIIPPDEPCLKYILDITIAYPSGKPLSLLDIVTGSKEPRDTFFLYKIYDTKQIPSDTEGMKKWLYNLFKQKDDVLQHFYNTGKFPVEMGDGNLLRRPVQQDNLKFVILHCTFIVSTYMHYCIFSYLYSLLW
ncbi:acyl-CoA:lysophosphatidylglycerol acyltransferase 1-like isoform X2 [Neocloeon triangulifer]|uniref:acyl-CoA:lysophosphatidylglycerol acyltransferase 1-like isoform X2 n=1 Tax=Neocloeon triangulifer TaxID=2078957 RepID=UPI00286F6A5A|nr:acyl-CoA:lysophosphatidylglycerol acyltransferase 1-like isoform X2 [Neocloeon triangulifer]